MLDYQERAKRTLRLLSTEFNEFIERLINHADSTPEILNTNLVTQVANLITSISDEKNDISHKITDYYKKINRELINRSYLEEAISELQVSDSLKNKLNELIDKHFFTEEQLKVILALVHETTEDVKPETNGLEELDMLDEKLHNQIQRSKQKSINPT